MSSLPMHRRAFGFVYDVAGLYFTKRVSRSAAELAYFLVLTFFPVLICVNAIIGTLNLDLTNLPAETRVLIPEAVLSVPSVGGGGDNTFFRLGGHAIPDGRDGRHF